MAGQRDPLPDREVPRPALLAPNLYACHGATILSAKRRRYSCGGLIRTGVGLLLFRQKHAIFPSLVVLPPAPDLLFCAKHLFVAAMVAICPRRGLRVSRQLPYCVFLIIQVGVGIQELPENQR